MCISTDISMFHDTEFWWELIKFFFFAGQTDKNSLLNLSSLLTLELIED